ncbi:hypothetical protein BASA81_001270 [Batrachochytrium salamandrivorans]|nr:hypothetical protein BASA81_001270 [Batrachochytrium salamandrivorans]
MPDSDDNEDWSPERAEFANSLDTASSSLYRKPRSRSSKAGRVNGEEDEEEGASCNVCGDWHQEESMLLCDRCNGGFHQHCLNPPLLTLPAGMWICPLCLAKEKKKPSSTTKRKKDQPPPVEAPVLPEAVVEEFDDGQPCGHCKSWKDWGSMLMCDLCDRGYHMQCLKPPLLAVPPGDWFCPVCDADFEQPKAKRRHKRVDSDELDWNVALDQDESSTYSDEDEDVMGEEDDIRLEYDRSKLFDDDELDGYSTKSPKHKKPKKKKTQVKKTTTVGKKAAPPLKVYQPTKPGSFVPKAPHLTEQGRTDQLYAAMSKAGGMQQYLHQVSSSSVAVPQTIPPPASPPASFHHHHQHHLPPPSVIVEAGPIPPSGYIPFDFTLPSFPPPLPQPPSSSSSSASLPLRHHHPSQQSSGMSFPPLFPQPPFSSQPPFM